MFRFVQCSDLHLGPLPEVGWRRLLGKRFLSYQSWHRKRKHYHLPEVVEALAFDMHTFAPEHYCVIGDLANLGLPEEIARAGEWLSRLAPPEKISLVPGNHDIYAFDSYPAVAEHWQDFMGEEFPYLHRRGPVAFIGLSTAVPTAPFFATGMLGEGQLAAFEALLEKAKRDGLQRIVLLHHPPIEGVAWRKRLADAEAFRAVIARVGAELILHGHLHIPLSSEIAGPEGASVPVLGAGSGSGNDDGHHAPGHYYRFCLEDDGRLDVESRYYNRASASFIAAGVFDLPLRRG